MLAFVVLYKNLFQAINTNIEYCSITDNRYISNVPFILFLQVINYLFCLRKVFCSQLLKNI